MTDSVFLVDLDRCFGCHTCEVACKQEKDLPVGPRPMQIIELGPRRMAGMVCRDFVPVFCFQCDEPRCLQICPSGAILKDPSGVVKIEGKKCVGCGLCQIACPYGCIGEYPNSLKAAKCDFCSSLREKGLSPSCVSHCPGNALFVGTEDDFQVVPAKFSIRIGRVLYISRNWKLSQTIINGAEEPLDRLR